MKKLSIVLVSCILLLVSVSGVFATSEECTTSTGSYGQTSTTCKVLGETTTVIHETVSAGIGDVSFWMVAQILTMVSVSGFLLSKLAERTYWFD